ncbi:DUF2165 family protein [Lichenicoccus sp.]|uniref:DUF2165 family protein n=1 Tax=Lichenicoccus sp. TaxID=2781899 RepID=UPI003D0BF19A
MTPNRSARTAKIGMVFSLAAFALLVAFNNVTDTRSNFLFVQHVLDMDTTFPGSALRWRALRLPLEWHAAYLAIILGEFATGLLFAVAGVRMLRSRAATSEMFAGASRLVHYATLAGFLVWFTGFSVVGGEWFAMWQSQSWNGQEPAFRFFITMLAVGLYVQQPE